MSNQFAELDSYSTPPRGEIVTIRVNVLLDGKTFGFLQWKRKAAYVNTSVNAFHMHRGLCREFRLLAGLETPSVVIRAAKRSLARLVYRSYADNSVSNEQYYEYAMVLTDTGVITRTSKEYDAVEQMSWELIPYKFSLDL